MIRSSNQATARFDARRRRARTVGAAAGVLAWLLGWFSLAALTSGGGESTVNDLLELLATSLWVGSPVLGYVVYAKLARPVGLLLWCRRFDPSYAKGVRFHRVLGAAAPAMVYPVTVQGGKFQASMMAAVLRRAALFPLILLTWGVGAVIAALAVGVVGGSGPLLLLVLLAWSALLWRLVMTFLARAGFAAVDPQSAPAHFSTARAGTRLPGLGVEVVKCPEQGEEWQDVVLAGMQLADVAVVDVSALPVSKSLQWELGTAIRVLGTGRVLLARADDIEATSELRSQILRIAAGSGHRDPAWLAQAWFVYPARQEPPGPGRRRQYVDLVTRLRASIASSLAHPRTSITSERS